MARHRSQSHHHQKETPMPEAKEVFSEIENRIKSKPEKAAGLNATYQFDLTGESWTLKIADGAATVSRPPPTRWSTASTPTGSSGPTRKWRLTSPTWSTGSSGSPSSGRSGLVIASGRRGA